MDPTDETTSSPLSSPQPAIEMEAIGNTADSQGLQAAVLPKVDVAECALADPAQTPAPPIEQLPEPIKAQPLQKKGPAEFVTGQPPPMIGLKALFCTFCGTRLPAEGHCSSCGQPRPDPGVRPPSAPGGSAAASTAGLGCGLGGITIGILGGIIIGIFICIGLLHGFLNDLWKVLTHWG